MNRGAAVKELPEVCSVKQVARFLGLAENSVYTAIRCGDIPSIRIGRRVLVSRDALLRLLAGGQ